MFVRGGGAGFFATDGGSRGFGVGLFPLGLGGGVEFDWRGTGKTSIS